MSNTFDYVIILFYILSNIIIYGVTNTRIATMTAAIVYFNTGLNNNTSVKYIENALGCEIQQSSNIANLSGCLSSAPSLILFHIDFLNNPDSTPQEFVQMVRTLCKYTENVSYCAVGVVIQKTTTWEQIKALKSAEIQGVIPASNDFGVDDTAKALRLLLEHRNYWPKHIIDQLSRTRRISRTAHSGIELTHRQKQVLDLVCNRGLSNKKIAIALKITESTVKIHVSAILRQYQVRNRTQLALAAKDHFRR